MWWMVPSGAKMRIQGYIRILFFWPFSHVRCSSCCYMSTSKNHCWIVNSQMNIWLFYELWFFGVLCCSSCCASSAIQGFAKTNRNVKDKSEIKNSELWAFLPAGICHRERQLYTLSLTALTWSASYYFHSLFPKRASFFFMTIFVLNIVPRHYVWTLSLTQIARWKLRKTLQLSGLLSRAK